MSILIKGMEMPPSDKALIMAYKDGRFIWIDLEGEKTYQYEAVEVSTPHGRLIDARVLQHDMMDMVQSGLYGLEDMIDAVIEAPTVIEAEKEG